MHTLRETFTNKATESTSSIIHQWFLVKTVDAGSSQKLNPYKVSCVRNQEKRATKEMAPGRIRAQSRMMKSSLSTFQECHARHELLRGSKKSLTVFRESLLSY